MNICIFEDEKYKNFFPLTLSRPVFELITGTTTIKQKILHFFPTENPFIKTRSYIEKIFSDKTIRTCHEISTESALFINGRLVPDESVKSSISSSEEKLFFSNETLVAAKVGNGAEFLKRLEARDFDGLAKEEISAKTVEYPWDLLSSNASEIEGEFALFGQKIPRISNFKSLGKQGIHIDDKAIVMAGTVLDATDGPIVIDKAAIVMANSFLKGPLYIGKQSLIKAGARIYGPTSIGDVCKIGGEISSSIFQGFSNKQHDGFMGHSYIGEWVNIGADTNNSDLKNNYKEVTVYIRNKPVKTGLTFVGTFIGDHSKTAINTVINTGAIVGFFANIFGEGFPPKFVPSFCWGGKRKFSTYKLEDSIETAARVMQRRNVRISDDYKQMMKEIFALTEPERVWEKV